MLTQVGSGTYISHKKPSTQEDGRSVRIKEVPRRFLREMATLGGDRPETVALVRDFKEEEWCG